MDTIILVMIVTVAVLMTFLILLQEGKGGGLASLGGTKAAAVEGVTNPIRRATGWLAGMFFVLLVMLALVNRPTKVNAYKGEDGATDAKKTEVKDATGGMGTTGRLPMTQKDVDELMKKINAQPATAPATPAASNVAPSVPTAPVVPAAPVVAPDPTPVVPAPAVPANK